MTPDLILFLALAVVAIASAALMLFSRNAVYAALFLIINFSAGGIIYLTLGAPFIALVQISVYAGAIMVLFLFVIMLLGTDKLPVSQAARWQIPLAAGLGVVLLAEVAYMIVFRSPVGASGQAMPALPANFGNPADIGMMLFNSYLLPFEITSVLLLVAVIGAIVLARIEKKRE
jgi:NADH-quinone oxidoreductase subunit J